MSGQLPLDIDGQLYGDIGGDPFGELDSPIHWPSLTGPERDRRLHQLVDWVDQLVDRFALDTRVVPPCWARHNALVETLSALRDHERASYHPTAPIDRRRRLAAGPAGCRVGAADHRRPDPVHRPNPPQRDPARHPNDPSTGSH